jgi:hypothetical protein
VVPGWLEQYLELEPAASLIRTYQVQVIPGLLQTEVYARAVVRLGRPDAPQAEVERRVELRMARQHILCREEPTRLWAVIDEASLRRPVGGPAVMRAQVQHLIEASRLPHVNLQVLPLGAGGHGACGGSISMLRFSQDELPDVVYLEHLFTAVYLNKPVDTANYRDTLDRLVAEAEPPGGGWHSGTGRGGPRGQVTQEVVAPSRWTLGGRCPRATASVIAAMDPSFRSGVASVTAVMPWASSLAPTWARSGGDGTRQGHRFDVSDPADPAVRFRAFSPKILLRTSGDWRPSSPWPQPA